VLVAWECEIARDVDKIAKKVMQLLKAR